MIKTLQRFGSALVAIFILLSSLAHPVSAARGIPGSPEFGVGARLSLTSPGLTDALNTMKDLRLDWLSIDFPWDAFQSESSSQPDWGKLDQAVNTAWQNHIAVLVSISKAPSWALRAQGGPEPEQTISFLNELTRRYPGKINAIELFPAPNTLKGWGGSPDPDAYLQLYKRLAAELAGWDKNIILLTGSLEVNKTPAEQDISDVSFLSALFTLGADMKFPVIGLRYQSVEGMPSDPVQSQNAVVLRHYEDIRELIKSSGRAASLVWITYMEFPETVTPEKQADYLSIAYSQIRSQLYIGSAFLQGINTCTQTTLNCREVSLRSDNGSLHPFYPAFRTILLHNAPTAPTEAPGHIKSDIFKKVRPH
jgi:hypothetical protein